ncbi:MAG: gliding motility-associated ABC transporter ATP-binding subunit GldA [Chitinophagales bacterium]|nr:gliding motility-associated ABC transporter ATP-binding subunit GldA [Chitinophagales bacterium]
MSVKVSNLTKQYGEQLAVNHISFELNKGEVLGFLGPNGAGKSTTMKMITGYIEPTEGTIEVCGINQQENPLQAKEKIGYLPENNPLYYDMYVKEYLGFVANLYKIKNKKERIAQLIEKTGLEREQHKKIGQLSKGYKQRVGIAQAMIHNPDVLILDEPTSGLDPNQLVDIRNLIKELGKEKTVILSTHIMQEVEAMCQRVLIINQGKIVANNKVESIKNTGTKTINVKFKLKTNKTQLPVLEQVQFEFLGNGFIKATSKQKQNLSEDIFNYCVQHQLTLLHLEQENQSMEDVFKELTK